MEKNIRQPLIVSEYIDDGQRANHVDERVSEEEQGFELAFDNQQETGAVNRRQSKVNFQRGGFNLNSMSAAVGLAVKKNKKEKMGLMEVPSLKKDGAAFYFKEFNKFMVYDKNSCYCFGEHSSLRRNIVWLLCHPFFEGFIIFMILLNSLFLACYDYGDRENLSKWNKMIEKSGLIFTVVFSIEALFKIIAMGFISHRNSYLKDAWNWLDFSVVCIGIVEVTKILPAQDVKALRVLRILRPLKSINSIPSMKRLIKSLLGSLKKLFDSVIILSFIFVLFGILGVRQFKGISYQRCRTTQAPIKGANFWERADEDRLCSMTKGVGIFTCPEGTYCGQVIDYPSIPFSSENVINQAEIAYGYMTFDHLGSAMITIFQMITLEGWSDLMYTLQDASTPWMAIMFCVLIVIIGSFFMLNLILAVIVDTFDSQDKEIELSAYKEARLLREAKALYGIKDSDDGLLHLHNEYEDEIFFNKTVPRKLSDSFVETVSESSEELPQRAMNNCFYRAFYYLCTHEAFGFLMTFCTILNTIILAQDKYPMDRSENGRLEQYNNWLSVVFLMELIIKLIGLGCKEYAADGFNLFDCTIVSCSIIELSVGLLGVQTSGGALTSLRALRLLRVFKLARTWKSFRELLQNLIQTLKDIAHFSILMLIFMFIFSLLGMEMFAFRIKFNNRNKDYALDPVEVPDLNEGWYPRSNFNTFLNSMITVFGILIGENWNSVMYDHLRAGSWAAYVFFITWFIFGNLILLNLFLAILLKNFEQPLGQDDEDFYNDVEKKESMLDKLKNAVTNLFFKDQQNQSEIESQMVYGDLMDRSNPNNMEALLSKQEELNQQSPTLRVNQNHLNASAQVRAESVHLSQGTAGAQLSQRGQYGESTPQRETELEMSKLEERQAILKKSNSKFSIGKIKKIEKKNLQTKKVKKINLEGNTLFIFSPVSGIRNIFLFIIGTPVFDNFILVMIGISSIMLTFEGPLQDPNGRQARILAQLDKAVTCIFIAECVFKIVVYGLISNGKYSYLRNSWNILDFFIVIMSTMLLLMENSKSMKQIKILRMLRVLRPLRMIARNPGMQIVVKSMLNAVPDILNVMVVSLLFLVLFAILGTNLYKGSFFYCLTDNVPTLLNGRILDKLDCMDVGGDWVNKDQNFDDVLMACLTLFNVMTTEGWLGVMWDAVDSNSIDMMPMLNHNRFSVFFFIFFIIMGSLFILNMFVGVVISVFNAQKEKLELNHLLTNMQRDWCDCLICIYKSEPIAKYKETGNKLKDFCYRTITYWWFDTIIMASILFNTICLALTWYGEPEELPVLLKKVGVLFNIVYTIEASMKIIALGSKYFDDNWNRFDFIIVLVTWTERIAKYALGVSQGSQTAVIRTLRVSRIFKVLKRMKNLRILFNTFLDALPQLSNVGALLFLFLFIYSVLGVFLFGQVKLQSTLNVHANFQTFGTALLTLFRMSTGESWNFIMYDSGRQKSITFDCKDEQTYQERVISMEGCGQKKTETYIYFLSFMLIVSFIFLNLFIVIIFESHENSQTEERLKINQFTIDKFVEIWSKFDPTATNFIDKSDLGEIIEEVIEEELRQVGELREKAQNGEIEQEEFQNSNCMFNLYRDLALVDVTLVKFEGKSIKVDENDTPEVKAEKMRKRRLMDKELRHFIGYMKLPLYLIDGVHNFYYYDILEGLSRNLFQNLLFDAREEKLKNCPEIHNQIDDNESVASFSSTATLQQGADSSEESQSIDDEAQEYENTKQIVRGDFEFILYKLEQSGLKKNILKYKTMQGLRTFKTKNQFKTLASFKGQVHDSSHLQAASIIIKHYKIWQKKQEINKKMQQQLKGLLSGKLQIPKAKVTEYVQQSKPDDIDEPDEQYERNKSPAIQKVDDFVDNCFYALQLDPYKGDEISRLRCAQLFYELMLGHNYGDAWNDKEFNFIYSQFQDDEPAENDENQGLDAKEFKKLCKRIAQF